MVKHRERESCEGNKATVPRDADFELNEYGKVCIYFEVAFLPSLFCICSDDLKSMMTLNLHEGFQPKYSAGWGYWKNFL